MAQDQMAKMMSMSAKTLADDERPEDMPPLPSLASSYHQSASDDASDSNDSDHHQRAEPNFDDSDFAGHDDGPSVPSESELLKGSGSPPSSASFGATPPPLLSAAVSKSKDNDAPSAVSNLTTMEPTRRVARRRPAGPVRGRIAANDDVPSIGGLIYALEQKPSKKVFRFAAIASVVWALVGISFAGVTLAPEWTAGTSFFSLLLNPVMFYTATAVVVPIAIFWLLALLNWHIASLSLKSSTMTEVAIRLAEPDRAAEQSIASLGQAVRRQVSFMNDAVSRALGRAGELEALVHNQVADLERSYEQNERRIRSLIMELSGERDALLNTSNSVTDTLKTLGTEIPTLIDTLSTQQVTLAEIIKGAGDNLAALEGSLSTSTGRFEEVLGDRTQHLQSVLEDYTTAFSTALGTRTEQMRTAFDGYMETLDTTLGNRTENLQTVFEEYARALDTTLSNRAQALDTQLIERTQSLDDAFQKRLEVFDDQIMRSTTAIDSAVSEKAELLTSALELHANTFRETMSRQAADLDDSVMNGINAVHRTSENITRQTMKAIDGLSKQSAALQSVSETLFERIHGATNRFETQGAQIMRAADVLDNANVRIDSTLQSRHADLNRTLEMLSGKADEFGRTMAGYSDNLEGSMSSIEERARTLTMELKQTAEERSLALISELERVKSNTEAESERAISSLRAQFQSVSSDLSKEFQTLTSRLASASDETRQRAAQAAEVLAREHARLREEAALLPATTRETAETMRRALQDQMRALEHLNNISARTAASRDIMRPELSATIAPPPSAGHGSPLGRAERSVSSSQQPISTTQSRGRGAKPGASKADGWSLGDLLARASSDDDAAAKAAASSAKNPNHPFNLDVGMIARAVDTATASTIWNRIRAGQHGVMVRSIYAPDARNLFDQVVDKLQSEASLADMVMRYLTDFERIIKESDQRDPTGRLAHTHLISETGRVYLFLAHAAGRLS